MLEMLKMTFLEVYMTFNLIFWHFNEKSLKQFTSIKTQQKLDLRFKMVLLMDLTRHSSLRIKTTSTF
jgi:hypothetical protein